MSNNPLDVQVGGAHYKDLPIQPVEFIHANGIGYFEGNVIKYVARWRKKNGIADLEKARHYIDLLIRLEQEKVEEEINKRYCAAPTPAQHPDESRFAFTTQENVVNAWGEPVAREFK